MKVDVIFKANAKLEIKASTSGRVPQQNFYFVASLVAFICAVFVKGCSPTFFIRSITLAENSLTEFIKTL